MMRERHSIRSWVREWLPGPDRTSHQAVDSRLLYRLSYRGIRLPDLINSGCKRARNIADKRDRECSGHRGIQSGSTAKTEAELRATAEVVRLA